MISRFKPATSAVTDPSPGLGLILIVDDEEPIRKLLLAFLTRRGYSVEAAATLAEARAALAKKVFDLAIVDLLLPDGDGMDLVRYLHDACQTPAIVMTGIGYDEGLLREAHEASAAAYISKLLPLDQLLMEVHRVLRPRA
jgi:DNA-binding response OmpR family regulator